MFSKLILTLFLSLPAYGQASAPSPAFEVASVKPWEPGVPVRMTGGPDTSDPGHWSCTHCNMTALLGNAYHVWEYQLVTPAWTQASNFDVAAKVPAGASRDDFRLMLQHLLEERFQLKAHREDRVIAVYELVLAKGGSKMVEVGAPAPAPPPGAKLDKDGFPIVPGGSGLAVANGRSRIQFRAQTMDNVAHYLSGQVGRPVLDATGLRGKYALMLSWYLPVSESGSSPGSLPAGDSGPTIFQAIQEQLGLKLEPRRMAVEFLVVDRLEKVPTAN
jgi:uncharacterized protein (TIGR03435 family)